MRTIIISRKLLVYGGSALVAASVFAFAWAFAGVCGAKAQTTNWDMPTPYGDTNFHTQTIVEFARDVEAATDGELRITVHSAGSLFPHAEIKNAVRSGQVPIGEFFLSRLANEDAAYALDSLPFLATSYPDARRLWNAQKPVIDELLAEQGLMVLYSVPWPAQSLYTNGEIRELSDFAGLRFRAYNAVLEEFATLVGAAPVQVEVPDIPQAFATGQVEAMLTSPSTGANTAAWDFVTHYTSIDAWVPKNIVVVNRRAFDRLSPNVQSVLMFAAAEAENRGWAKSAAETDAKLDILEANGMTILPPTEALQRGLRDIGVQMLANWRTRASDSALAILDDYQ